MGSFVDEETNERRYYTIGFDNPKYPPSTYYIYGLAKVLDSHDSLG
jgi:hypothetical protein